jgi:hypothetical protein
MTSNRRRIINVLAQQLRVSGNAIVGLLIVRLVYRSMGEITYANLAVVLSVIGYVGILGNSITGAMARYLSKCVSQDAFEDGSDYFSNSFLAVASIAVFGEFVIVGGYLVNRAMWGALPLLFIMTMMAVPVLNCAAGILATGNFVRERFVNSSLTFLFGRLLYLAITWSLVKYIGMQYWSVAIANIMSGMCICVIFWFMFRNSLPQVRFRLTLLSRTRVVELFGFVGWMLIVYAGIFLITSGVLVVTRTVISNNDVLVKIALGFQVGSIVNQMMTSIGVATSPATYRYLAQNHYRQATQMVEHFLYLAIIMGVAIGLVLSLEWNNLLSLWPGNQRPDGMGAVLSGAVFSFVIGSFGVPLSVFFAGIGRVRTYGIICLIEGVVTVLFVYVSLRFWPNNAFLVCLLPGLVGMSKLLFVYTVNSSEFQPSTLRKYFSKVCYVLGVAMLGVCIWLGLRNVLPVVLWPIPLAGLLSPFVLFFMYSFKRIKAGGLQTREV